MRVNGELSEDLWQLSTAVDAFVQREPEEGGKPSQRTEFRVAYDATTLYVKVRAFDTEAARIAATSRGATRESPSDWIRVLIDSYHDRRTAYEFAVNPVGVKQDRYWFNDNNSDDSWDAVWDVKVATRRARLDRRVPDSVFTAALQSDASSTFGFAVSRQIGRLNETSTWPLLARSATGYVSSFGDLGGLSMAASPKRLEILPYIVADVTRAADRRQPAHQGVRAVRRNRHGHEVRADAGPHLDDDDQSGLRPGGSRPRRRQSVGVRNVFQRAASVLRRRVRQFPVRRRLPERSVPDVLLAAGGPFAARSRTLPSERRRGVYTDAPVQSTILGAAKLTGRVGKFSIGAMHAVTRGGIRQGPERPGTLQPPGRAVDELLGGTSTPGIREPVRDRVHDHRRHAAAAGVAAVPARTAASPAASTWICASRSASASPDTGRRAACTASAEAIKRLQENSRHYLQRPDATESGASIRRERR